MAEGLRGRGFEDCMHRIRNTAQMVACVASRQATCSTAWRSVLLVRRCAITFAKATHPYQFALRASAGTDALAAKVRVAPNHALVQYRWMGTVPTMPTAASHASCFLITTLKYFRTPPPRPISKDKGVDFRIDIGRLA